MGGRGHSPGPTLTSKPPSCQHVAPESHTKDVEQEATRTLSCSGLDDSVTFTHIPLGHSQAPDPPSCSSEAQGTLDYQKAATEGESWLAVGNLIIRTDNGSGTWQRLVRGRSPGGWILAALTGTRAADLSQQCGHAHRWQSPAAVTHGN